MRQRLLWMSLLVLLTTPWSTFASATAIYVYTGNEYVVVQDDTPPDGVYTSDMRVEGQFSLAAPLANDLALTDIRTDVTDYSFFDGRVTLTDANSAIVFFDVATSASGEISEWNLRFQASLPASPVEGDQRLVVLTNSTTGTTPQDRAIISECIDAADCLANLNQDQAFVNANPGTWALVPEPASGVLLGSALLSIALARRWGPARADRGSPGDSCRVPPS